VWQRGVHEALRRVRFAVLVVHRRGGKTVLAVNALVDAALRVQRPDGRFAYLAPLLKQARDIAWDYLRGYTEAIPGVEYHESLLEVRLPNGARIRLYGADNPDALRGIYLDGVVLDEVADMRPNLWGEVIRPTLADRHGWALFIGTPRGINLFSELYYKALNDPAWFAKTLTYEDTQTIAKEEVDSARAMMTERQFAQEFLCDFQAGSDDSLIPVDLARSCAGRHLPLDQYQFAPRVIGVDVARYGDDRTAIVHRQGLVMFEPVVLRGMDTQGVISRVAAEAQRWSPQMIFIDTGGNPGVFDGLRASGFTCSPVEFGAKPTRPEFLNKRVEMWVAVRDWLKTGAAIPKDEALIADLCAPRFTFRNARGLVQLESKDDLRGRGLASPDLGDALACTFSYPLAPRIPGVELDVGKVLIDDDDAPLWTRRDRVLTEYDRRGWN
jgi:hypothetical protein